MGVKLDDVQQAWWDSLSAEERAIIQCAGHARFEEEFEKRDENACRSAE